MADGCLPLRSWPSRPREELLARMWEVLDPRLAAGLRAELEGPPPALALDPGRRVVLVGHRAAGKSRLLPLVAEWLGWPALDLDRELEGRSGRSLHAWLGADPAGFRHAERELFRTLPPAHVIAAGGGFLSLHGDALSGDVAVLVPISRETYRERLLADASRPRLRPDLPLADELEIVYADREARHARVATWSLPAFLRATEREP
ncbi:MAG TPA: shikimate kinase [Myxococcales bacterium]|nr:shikimate kinase [Myxococcales bacterium]